ncbi:hypothetical protein [Sorangium sp. So ce1099]
MGEELSGVADDDGSADRGHLGEIGARDGALLDLGAGLQLAGFEEGGAAV